MKYLKVMDQTIAEAPKSFDVSVNPVGRIISRVYLVTTADIPWAKPDNLQQLLIREWLLV